MMNVSSRINAKQETIRKRMKATTDKVHLVSSRAGESCRRLVRRLQCIKPSATVDEGEILIPNGFFSEQFFESDVYDPDHSIEAVEEEGYWNPTEPIVARIKEKSPHFGRFREESLAPMYLQPAAQNHTMIWGPSTRHDRVPDETPCGKVHATKPKAEFHEPQRVMITRTKHPRDTWQRSKRVLHMAANWKRTNRGMVMEEIFTTQRIDSTPAVKHFRTANRWLAPLGKPKDNHHHGLLAELRWQATRSMDNFAHQTGMTRYDESTSTREGKSLGQRDWHVSKDILQKPRRDAIPTTGNVLITMVDVDPHMTPEQFSSIVFGRHAMLYNVEPPQLCGNTPESYWLMRNARTYVERVFGGGEYVHMNYDWDREVVVLPFMPCRWNMHSRLQNHFFPRYCLYQVHRRPQPTTKHRMFVFLNPVCEFRDIRAYMYKTMALDRDNLNRVAAHTDGEWIQQRYAKKTKKGPRMYRSIQRVGAAISVEITEECYESLRGLFEHKEGVLSLADVQRNMPGDKRSQQLSQVLFRALPNLFAADPRPLNSLNEDPEDQEIEEASAPADICDGKNEGVQHVNNDASGLVVNDEKKKVGFMVGPPVITTGPVSPVVSRSNDQECVQERIENVRNTADSWLDLYGSYLTEFVLHIIPTRAHHSGKPFVWKQVYDRQTRPEQRNRNLRMKHQAPQTCLAEEGDGKYVDEAQSFQKREFYATPSTAPRNITNVSDTHNNAMSRFTLPLMDFMRFERGCAGWFCPGKKPKEVQDCLRKFGSMLREEYDGKILNTDFSKFDGTQSLELHLILRLVMRSFYHEDHHAEIDAVMDADVNLRVRTRQGVKYSSGGGQASGSPTTTLSNTVVAGFEKYVGNRLAGMDPGKAYARIGPTCGDDCWAVPECRFEEVSERVGTRLKCELSHVDEPQVYLGRVWFDVGRDIMSSIAQPKRVLQKICGTTRNAGTPQLQALGDRVYGYAATDENSPLIGPYCEAVKRIIGDKYDKHKMSRDTGWRIKQGPYYLDPGVGTRAAIVNYIANDLQVAPRDIELWEIDVQLATDLEHFPKPLCTPLTKAPAGKRMQINGRLFNADSRPKLPPRLKKEQRRDPENPRGRLA